jgi:fatty acid desaturase
MIRGIDPETDWPEVFTSRWMKAYLLGLISRILVVGAVYHLFKDIWMQTQRVFGIKDRMMQNHCSPEDIRIIRIESFGILLFHTAVVAVALYTGKWQLLLFITIAWQIGMGIEHLWHQTEHIGRPYNVNDQRVCTRSIKVSPFVKMIYWGLDDHVEHHIFPVVPSKNLPKLHQMLLDYVPEQTNIIECWKEMFAIAKAKDQHPEHEYVPLVAFEKAKG